MTHKRMFAIVLGLFFFTATNAMNNNNNNQPGSKPSTPHSTPHPSAPNSPRAGSKSSTPHSTPHSSAPNSPRGNNQKYTMPNQNNNAIQGLGLFDEFAKQGLKTGWGVIGTQANEAVNQIKRDTFGIIPPLETAQLDDFKSRLEVSEQQKELNTQQKEINNKDKELKEKQEIQLKHEIFKQQLEEFVTIKNLDSNNPEHEKTLKRLQLRAKELNIDLPELPAEEPKKTEPPKEDDKPKQDGYLKALASYCFIAAATAGDAADVIADYSFKNITDLDCFKETFVRTHHKIINRALVGATLTILSYKAYSLYKKYMKERNEKDEDIFNDDLD